MQLRNSWTDSYIKTLIRATWRLAVFISLQNLFKLSSISVLCPWPTLTHLAHPKPKLVQIRSQQAAVENMDDRFTPEVSAFRVKPVIQSRQQNHLVHTVIRSSSIQMYVWGEVLTRCYWRNKSSRMLLTYSIEQSPFWEANWFCS